MFTLKHLLHNLSIWLLHTLDMRLFKLNPIFQWKVIGKNLKNSNCSDVSFVVNFLN